MPQRPPVLARSRHPEVMRAPLLIVVNGLPCTGKTTIGRRIAEFSGLPFVYKDGIKEIIFDTLGWKDRRWSKSASLCAFELLFFWLEALLTANCSLIIEGNFRRQEHTARFESLRQQAAMTVVEVLCKTEGRVLWQRFRQRTISGPRHPGHVDAQTFAELKPRLLQGRGDALGIGDFFFEVDTTDFATIDLTPVLEVLGSRRS